MKNRKMKKTLSLCLAAAFAAGHLTIPAAAEEAESLQIITTIFPEYDWVMNILGDNPAGIEVSMLLDNGVDLHSYQPTVEDITNIVKSDMFVYVGGESDEWVEDALAQSEKEDMAVVNLVEAMGEEIKAEEIVEGMEHEHEHEHDHSKEVSTFEDDEVQDRSLSDWEGDWQSGYPLALDGSLDEAFEAKAENGTMTAEEYKDYYIAGYESEYATISIHDNIIAFTDMEGNTAESVYEYTGYYIQDWSTGTRAAMYRFEAVDKDAGAPVYIEFNDHMIEPEKAEHFHIRMSNESYDAIEDPENKWPTFFPAEYTPDEVCDALAGHDHHEDEDEHEHEDGEEHEDEHEEEEHDHEHEEEADEHVWLSLRNAQKLVQILTDSICTIDPANAETYQANADSYIAQLADLDTQYEQMVNGAARNTVLFGDRFPFRYMMDDYGIEYYVAFSGCSAESEASFETIAFLAGKVDELSLPVVLTLEDPKFKIAETVIENTVEKTQKILAMDSLQSTTSADAEGGVTYLSAMEQNLAVLTEALQ